MRARPTAIGIACALLLLAVPGDAWARATIAPPGKSGADQYFETVPTARGNIAPPQGPAGSPAPGSVAALASARSGERSLSASGRDGQAAAALNKANAPAPAPRGPVPSSSGSSASSFAHLLGGTDAGGLGVAFPIALATALLVAIAIVAARLRRRDTAV